MPIEATTSPTDTLSPPPIAPGQRRGVAVRRSYLEAVIRQTARQRGAAVGLTWLIVVGLAAVFAPFLASSHPLMMSVDGSWSSPLLSHLTAADVVVLVAGIAAALVTVLPTRLSIPQRVSIVAWSVAVALPAALWPQAPDAFESGYAWFLPAEELWRDWSVGDWAAAVFVRSLAAGGLLVSLGVWAWVALILPFLARLPRWHYGVIGAVAAVVGLTLITFPVDPPLNVVYDQYRVQQAAGESDWAVYTPIPFSPTDRLRDQPELNHPLPPSQTHLMGTTPNGADLLSRMIHAARIAIAVGFIATSIALAIGVSLGGLMGYFSGLVDLLGMRLVEIVSAIPTFFLLLAFVAFFDRNLYMMMVIIGVTSWVGYARFVRAEFLKLRAEDFVQSARATGLPLRSILFRHMLPNGVAPVLVEASFGVAAAILYESTLSFLGLGLVDEPSWGQMLSHAVGAGGGFVWWMATYPGGAIFLTVLAFNLIGEALRDTIDPRTAMA